MLKRMTEGHIVPGSAPPPSEESPGGGGDDDEEEGDEENAGDEEFLGSYRRRRLEQLKASAGRPHFGQIRETDRTSFVSEVDTEDPRTFVVVHLYEPYIGACGRMNRFLEVICRSMKHEGSALRLVEGMFRRGRLDGTPYCWTPNVRIFLPYCDHPVISLNDAHVRTTQSHAQPYERVASCSPNDHKVISRSVRY